MERVAQRKEQVLIIQLIAEKAYCSAKRKMEYSAAGAVVVHFSPTSRRSKVKSTMRHCWDPLRNHLRNDREGNKQEQKQKDLFFFLSSFLYQRKRPFDQVHFTVANNATCHAPSAINRTWSYACLLNVNARLPLRCLESNLSESSLANLKTIPAVNRTHC